MIMNGSFTVIFHKRINELLAAEFPTIVKKEIYLLISSNIPTCKHLTRLFEQKSDININAACSY